MNYMDLNMENLYLRKRLLELEQQLKDEKARHKLTSDLLMRGEALREQVMFTAILSGTFSGGNIANQTRSTGGL